MGELGRHCWWGDGFMVGADSVFGGDHLGVSPDLRVVCKQEVEKGAQVTFGTMDDLLDYIQGASIEGGGSDEEGSFHLYLSAGRVLVITSIRGHVALAVVDQSQELLH